MILNHCYFISLSPSFQATKEMGSIDFGDVNGRFDHHLCCGGVSILPRFLFPPELEIFTDYLVTHMFLNAMHVATCCSTWRCYFLRLQVFPWTWRTFLLRS